MRKNTSKKKTGVNSKNSKENNIIKKEDLNFYSLENNDMLGNLIRISGNQEVYKELKDETSKIKQLLSNSKEKLKNINLYENQISDIDIYQWNNLFNQSIPITSYVSSSKSIKNKNNKKEEIKDDIESKDNSQNIKHPIALVDLTDEEIKKYLPPPIAGIPPSRVIRFQKLPFKGNSKDAFYFSNAFNDYYKMDFKEFIKIMPVLKAKKRCQSAKLTSQIKKSRKISNKEGQKREIYNNEMLDKLNNLYIEKQYLSLSLNSNNIQPLMSSIHSQIHPGEGDELTKHTKMYTKTNKPLGSERDVNSIDYTVNLRNYHRNVLNRSIYHQQRPKSEIRKMHLSKYDINDPDIAIFKRIELLEKLINEGENNFSGNQFLIDEKEENSLINCDGESKEKEDKKIIKKEDLLNKEEIENNKKNNNHKLMQNEDKKLNRTRAVSAKREIRKIEEITNISNKRFPRALSAHAMRPLERQNDYCIHNIYLTSRNKFHLNSFRRGKKNKLNDIFDENKKGNTSSQISTYEGINNSIYEKQNIPSRGFPYKTNHQIPNKIYLKINNILKEKQYEKYQRKLEQFSKLIQLDDAFLFEDKIKEKVLNKNINNQKNDINELKYIDKNKIFNRPLQNQNVQNLKKMKNSKINLNNQLSPKMYKLSKNNNFRAGSKKSSNENSKIEFSTSMPNTKYEYFMNNKNDKVTLVYFNDMIEMKPQKIEEMKPLIKNDGIIIAPNYFNRGKPQLINYYKKLKQNNNLRRVNSGKFFGGIPKLKDNTIIQEEFLGYQRGYGNNNKIKRKRIFSAKI